MAEIEVTSSQNSSQIGPGESARQNYTEVIVERLDIPEEEDSPETGTICETGTSARFESSSVASFLQPAAVLEPSVSRAFESVQIMHECLGSGQQQPIGQGVDQMPDESKFPEAEGTGTSKSSRAISAGATSGEQQMTAQGRILWTEYEIESEANTINSETDGGLSNFGFSHDTNDETSSIAQSLQMSTITPQSTPRTRSSDY